MNVERLIPPAEDMQEMFVDRFVIETIVSKLNEFGTASIYYDCTQAKFLDLDEIADGFTSRGYTVTVKIDHIEIKLPQFKRSE